MIKILIPDWGDSDPIKLELVLLGGQSFSLLVSPEEKGTRITPLAPSSKIILPSIEKIDFAYNFLESKKETALLRINGMFSYRENFEFFRSMGAPWVASQATAVYKKSINKTRRKISTPWSRRFPQLPKFSAT